MSLASMVLVGLLAVAIVLAAVSAWGTIESVNAEDAGSAWGWTGIFLGTSLMATWLFWSLV